MYNSWELLAMRKYLINRAWEKCAECEDIMFSSLGKNFSRDKEGNFLCFMWKHYGLHTQLTFLCIFCNYDDFLCVVSY